MPNNEQMRGTADLQEGELIKRFEELEGKLRRLESIGLSHSGSQEALADVQDDRCRAEGNPDLTGLQEPICSSPEQLDEQIQQISHGSASSGQKSFDQHAPQSAVRHIMIREPIALMDRLPERCLSPWTTQFGVLQAHAIEECRAGVARLAQEAVEETQGRLNSLAKEMISLLHGEMKKSLDNFTNVVASRVVQSLEQQIQAATHRSVDAALECMKSVAVQITAGPGTNQESSISGSKQCGEDCQREPVRTLPSIVEEIQTKPGALLSDLQNQMRNILQAFQERASKEVAEQFRTIASELLHREIKQLQGVYDTEERLDVEFGRPAESLSSAITHSSPADVSNTCGLASHTPKPKAGKPHGAAPNWRILGLSLWLIIAGPVLVRVWH
ncbi:MAG TPA: hypothetical protein VMX16_04825 [Terriglobia bacterium]|nr:hypothetical protein [Terriglobia bacterium]